MVPSSASCARLLMTVPSSRRMSRGASLEKVLTLSSGTVIVPSDSESIVILPPTTLTILPRTRSPFLKTTSSFWNESAARARDATSVSMSAPNLGSALRTTRRLQRDRAEAELAGLRRRRGRGLLALHPVDLLHEEEDRERDDREVDDGADEDAVIERRNPRRLGLGQGARRRLLGEVQEHVREVELPE